MAIPAPSMMVGEMNEMWIRQDWLDKLGLEVPRTWDEMAAVAEAFVTQDPDGNGEADTIGILGPGNSDHMNATGANQFGLDPLFSSFQSYPQYWLQDEDGNVQLAHSISAGLDYPGVGPEHAYLKDSGRAEYVAIKDDEAMDALMELCKLEGIIPAIESAHAVAYAKKQAKKMKPDDIMVVCLSGRGDKDVNTIADYLAGKGYLN